MAVESRSPAKLSSPGPFLAEVTNHLDATYMGCLEVALIKGIPSRVNEIGESFVVRYLSPFAGNTSIRFEGSDPKKFNDVQKSYGFWMIPPDIGTTVMVIFVDGDPNQGYWFGCVNDVFQNHMVPGIAASNLANITPDQENKYGTKYLPVAEYHKGTASDNLKIPNVNQFSKPVHPFAERLVEQGLLLDTIRGVTSSSARREVPSGVFGISTPGPLDTSAGAPRKDIGFESRVKGPVSRLGGTTFVMDDGDIDGQNELVRLRTRTGHQILLHNSQDLIYIANSKGTAWIEMTSKGKIDIYAQDSVSIHTKGDFNLKAARDFNLEAGRNFNIAADGDYNLNIKKDIHIIGDNLKTAIMSDYNLTTGDSIKLATSGNLSSTANGSSSHAAKGNFGISSSAAVSIGSKGNLSLGSSSEVRVSGSEVHLNGPGASAPSTPEVPEQPKPLNLFKVPQTDASAGRTSWENKQFYKASDLLSIMQRVPMHEPWSQHENFNPDQFTLEATDSSIQPATVSTATGAVIEQGAPQINGSTQPTPSANTPYPAKNGPAGDRGTVQYQPFSWSTDQPFLNKVKEVASKLSFPPIELLSCMNLESNRTFDPAIDNKVGASKDPEGMGFVGLIQFGTDAARELGVTKRRLISMSRVEQLEYVLKYFRRWGWPSKQVPNPTLVNIYLTILLPAFRFSPLDEQIAKSGDPKSGGWYRANNGFDPGKLGYFTPAMVEKVVSMHRREVLQCLANAGVGTDLVVPASALASTNKTGTVSKAGPGSQLAQPSGDPIKRS